MHETFIAVSAPSGLSATLRNHRGLMAPAEAVSAPSGLSRRWQFIFPQYLPLRKSLTALPGGWLMLAQPACVA